MGTEDNNRDLIIHKIERVSENLRKNNMQVFYAEKKEDVYPIVESLLKENDVIACGGSVSVSQCGLIELFKSGRYKFLDRNAVSADEAPNLYRESFFSDAYFCSANAVTEDGELYNVDGNSNRIAAICYGPKSVIVVAGYNKIVKDIDEAAKRVKCIAAPANCRRLSYNTFCNNTGECISLSKENSTIASGCAGDTRICCNYLISAQQRIPNRIKVILVGEELGF